MTILARGSLAGSGCVVEWLFTDRHGGVSVADYDSLNLGAHVADDPACVSVNRMRVAAELGAEHLAVMHQVHGRDVARVHDVADDPPSVDAIITSTPLLPLATQVADCVPVLLADPVGAQVAAVHAGWRGLAAGVVTAALEQLGASGPVSAWVGPAICPDCYEVSDEVRAQAVESVPAAYAVTRSGTPAIDLRGGVLAQLAAAGITGQVVGGCTLESPDLFSYRRSSVTGRQAGVIMLR